MQPASPALKIRLVVIVCAVAVLLCASVGVGLLIRLSMVRSNARARIAAGPTMAPAPMPAPRTPRHAAASAPPLMAIPAQSVINAPVSILGREPKDPNSLIILDGSPSGAGLEYQWVQTSGTPLSLFAGAMHRDRVGLHINTPGTYTFDLTVKQNGFTSAPATVTVNVSPANAPSVPNNNSGAEPKGEE